MSGLLSGIGSINAHGLSPGNRLERRGSSASHTRWFTLLLASAVVLLSTTVVPMVAVAQSGPRLNGGLNSTDQRGPRGGNEEKRPVVRREGAGRVVPAGGAGIGGGVGPGMNPGGAPLAGAPGPLPVPFGLDPEQLTTPQGLNSSLRVMVLMTVLSLAPSILIMTTCFIRFVVVLGLMRQAVGSQQLPPNQVLTSLCLFLTVLVMSPIWTKAYQEGIRPYTNPAAGEQPVDEQTAFIRTMAPLRQFMSEQIELAGNGDGVWMFVDLQRPPAGTTEAARFEEPQTYDDLPLTVLIPAYILSELKVAFVIGFQIFLPFLVIDLVTSTLLTGLGMTLLPPSTVSVPFKLLLFVLIDGWRLTVGMLLESVHPG